VPKPFSELLIQESLKAIIASHEWLPHPGGLATFYYHLADALATEGNQVIILTAQNEPTLPSKNGIELVNLSREVNQLLDQLVAALPEKSSLASYSIAIGRCFSDWLKNHTPSENCVIFAPEFLGYASYLAASDLPPLIVTAHGSMGQIHDRTSTSGILAPPGLLVVRHMETDALLRADATTAYSPSNAAEWTRILGKEAVLIPPCFTPPEQPLSQMKTSSYLAQPPIRGVVAGRFQCWKGVETLAEALEQVAKELPHVCIDWYGSDCDHPLGGPMSSYLAERYPKVYGKSLIRRDPVNRNILLSHQVEADFACVPSEWDTFNFTAAEAMASNTPLIISTGAGASFMVEHGVSGLCFEPKDANELAANLRKMAGLSDAERMEMGTRGRQALEQQLDPHFVAQQYIKLAEQALSSRESDPERFKHLQVAGIRVATDWLLFTSNKRCEKSSNFAKAKAKIKHWLQ